MAGCKVKFTFAYNQESLEKNSKNPDVCSIQIWIESSYALSFLISSVDFSAFRDEIYA
jgi:hypothetical protein